MIVYKNDTQGFIKDVRANQIADKIKESIILKLGWIGVSPSEQMSFSNSMQFLCNVIDRAAIADDCGILIEYNLPSTSLRVDFIISGHDENGNPSFIIIELKQWQEAEKCERQGLVWTKFYNRYSTHPSYQAYSYKLYLKDFNENIYNTNLKVYSCAYLHNYSEKTPEPLKDEVYKEIIKESPIYFKDDEEELEEFIRIYVGKGKGNDILYQIESGNIRPSKKLIDHVNGLLKGNEEFVLLDDQKIAFESVKEIALKSKKKKVIIIHGGPGTGKSVLSINLLGELLKYLNIIFVAPNASFRDVMIQKLADENQRQRLRHLFKGGGSFFGARKNTFDAIIVDEAHRLKDNRAFMYQGQNQVEDIINAARVSIFFIDDKQLIRPSDIGTVAEIKRLAETYEADVEEFTLHAQFRCSGSDGYINWIEDVLQLEKTGNFSGWDKNDFEFKLFRNPNDLHEAIMQKNKEGYSARLLAGYAWEWTNKGNQNAEIDDIIIPEFGFSMPWNSRSSSTTWAVDDSGINQIGCVHTSQGLEFDYVGVIIGNDLRMTPMDNSFHTNWKEYYDNAGRAGLRDNLVELNKLVRQIYRILLTRGMKGCYVYCKDDYVEEYFEKRLLSTENNT